MTIEEEGPDLNLTNHHHLLDWLEDSISFLPSFLDEPFSVPDEINAYAYAYEWWNQDQIHPIITPPPPESTTPTSPKPISPPPLPQPEFSKKRKQPTDPTTHKASHHHRRRTTEIAEEGDGDNEEEEKVQRKPINERKPQGKSNGGNSGNSNKDVRWAEQLLNPCAIAIDTGNVSRVQHLLYVLHELASASGDANHRLASHGLRALTHHLSTTGIGTRIGTGIGQGVSTSSHSFLSTEPRLFRSALIKFNEVSPWFAFPNSLANSSILETLPQGSTHQPRTLHIVDIGVSHGIQWPTLLDALTRRLGGAPSLVRLTVVKPTTPGPPFSAAPPGYDFPSHLLRYAKSIDLNLQINLTDGALDPRTLAIHPDETLIVCVQFRAHQMNHDDRTTFLRSIRGIDPDLVVLSEIDGDCSCERCGGFAAGFGRRVEVLWAFLESTSAAFKGRECGERRVVEGEAGRVVEAVEAAAGGRRERWREGMVGLGFREEGFGEEAVEGGRALLRKYDGNWEMKVVEEAVCLGWKGQPVSFCSLWKIPK